MCGTTKPNVFDAPIVSVSWWKGLLILGSDLMTVPRLYCADKFFLPKLEDHDLTDVMMQFQDQITKQGEMVSLFLCRRKTCLWVCWSVEWPNNNSIGHGHYWCPRCAKLYQPWVKSTDRVRANKVMFYKLSDFTKKPLPSTATSGVGSQGGEYRIVPYFWLDTIGQNCENRFKRVASG